VRTPEGIDEQRLRAGFEIKLEHAKISISDEEKATLFQGYKGLQGLLSKIPRDIPMAEEPAFVGLVAEVKVSR